MSASRTRCCCCHKLTSSKGHEIPDVFALCMLLLLPSPPCRAWHGGTYMEARTTTSPPAPTAAAASSVARCFPLSPHHDPKVLLSLPCNNIATTTWDWQALDCHLTHPWPVLPATGSEDTGIHDIQGALAAAVAAATTAVLQTSMHSLAALRLSPACHVCSVLAAAVLLGAS